MKRSTSQYVDTVAAAWLPPWDGAAYAANTAHHRVHDDDFLRSLPLRSTDRLLDLGCGSGDFTATLAAAVPGGHVIGLDAQPSMLDEARARALPNQSFVLATAQQLADAGIAPGTIDVVSSRAVLHWVPAPDIPGVYAAVAELLRPGGWFRVDCGGAGNVAAVITLLGDIAARHAGPNPPGNPWNFADAGTAMTWLEQAGLDHEAGGRGWVRTVAQRRRFDEAGLRGWLHSQALAAYEPGMADDARAAFRAEADDRLGELQRADGTYDQTYVRLDLLAQRPGPGTA